MSKPFIPIILGTAREGRQSEQVANFAYELLKDDDRFDTELVDVKNMITPYTIPSWVDGEKAAVWRKIAARASGFIIVSPEYNHGYPGELKILWDYAFDEYKKKPVGLVAISRGSFGGARFVENFLPVLQACKMTMVPATVYISEVETFQDEKEKHGERMKKMVDTIIEYI